MTVFCVFQDSNNRVLAFNDMMSSLSGQPSTLGKLTAIHDYEPNGKANSSKLYRYVQKSVILGNNLFLFSGAYQEVTRFLHTLTSDPEFDPSKPCGKVFDRAVEGNSASVINVHRANGINTRKEHDCDIQIDGDIAIIGEGKGFSDIANMLERGPSVGITSVLQKHLGNLIMRELNDPEQPDKGYGGAYEIVVPLESGFKKVEYRLDYFNVLSDALLGHTKALRVGYRKQYAIIGTLDSTIDASSDDGKSYAFGVEAAANLGTHVGDITTTIHEIWCKPPAINIHLLRCGDFWKIGLTPWELIPIMDGDTKRIKIHISEKFIRWQQKTAQSFFEHLKH